MIRTATQFLGEVSVNENGLAAAASANLSSFRLRGLGLNQRPLGYDPFPIQDWSQGATTPRKLELLTASPLGLFGPRWEHLLRKFLGEVGCREEAIVTFPL